jgi:N6-L-threonylcarbamoyladenine synthase
MIILGIESSCDETSVAILGQKKDRIQILSNIVASSALLQSKYGGIIPEQAAREQLASIIPVLKEAMEQAEVSKKDVDAIAVTAGPGLIGSLLVGVETAKALATIWQKPLIPVNHLIGHFYANWITDSDLKSSDLPQFPCIGLLVSGGHSDLVLFTDHGKYKYLGGTRDDAAGECFDKCARLLDLPYPGGPQISKLAKDGNPQAFNLPRPMLYSADLDFSFSGLKTAVANLLKQVPQANKADLCAGVEQAIVDVLVKKAIKAAKTQGIEQVIVAGGVAANQKLIQHLKAEIESLKLKITLHVPLTILCTDNAAMIASAAFFIKPIDDPLGLQANPNLSLAY